MVQIVDIEQGSRDLGKLSCSQSLGVDPFKNGLPFFDLLVDPWNNFWLCKPKRMMTLGWVLLAYLLFLERWIFEVVSEEMGAFFPILLYVSSGWGYCLSGCQDRHLFSGWSASFFSGLGEGDDHSSFKTNGLNWMDLGLIAQQCWMRRVGDRSQVQGLKEEG
ncbi:hypothetical protein AAG906_003870 [Vitis piasezkii]